MADIISLDERLKGQRDKQLSEQKKKRLTSLRMVMECSNCPRKCAKCGSQLEAPEPRILSPELPLRLVRGLLGGVSDLSEVQSGAVGPAGPGELPEPGLDGGLEILDGLPDQSAPLPEFPGIPEINGGAFQRGGVTERTSNIEHPTSNYQKQTLH